MTKSVYERLRAAILDGTIAEGQVLSENGLAADFGTSRTPVREALHRLENERIIERGPRGATVRTSSPEEILDIYDTRITLEGAAARRAALQASPLDLARVKAKQADMRALEDPAGRAAANRAFHEALWSASHSPTLVDLLDRLNVHLSRYPTSTLADDQRWQEALDEHDQIVDAISRGDAVAARTLAEHHMSAARESRLGMYAQS